MRKFYAKLLFLVLTAASSVAVAQFVQIGTGSTTASYLTGSIYRSAATSTFNFSKYVTLDLSTYPKGLYMVKIQMNGVSVIERIAVQ